MMFKESGLEYLAIGDFLVRKNNGRYMSRLFIEKEINLHIKKVLKI